MRKKLLDFICGLALLSAFLVAIGSVGAYELGSISGGECVVRFAAAAGVCIGLGCFNALLMDAAERYGR